MLQSGAPTHRVQIAAVVVTTFTLLPGFIPWFPLPSQLLAEQSLSLLLQGSILYEMIALLDKAFPSNPDQHNQNTLLAITSTEIRTKRWFDKLMSMSSTNEIEDCTNEIEAAGQVKKHNITLTHASKKPEVSRVRK